jgi:small redox-active disulfide protein 2
VLKLQILGTGCSKCETLALWVDETARDLGLEFELEKISDIDQITDFGIMSTPGLVVNGKVMAAGRLPSKAELKEILQK